MNSEQLAKKLTEFTFKLFESLSKNNDENFFISPLSISTALTMCFAGANASTADQLQAGLCLDNLTRDEIFAMNREFFESLNKVLGSDVTLKTANKVFQHHKHPLLTKYLDDLKNHFASDAKGLNFADSTNSAKDINDWVLEKTEGKIKDLVSPDLLDDLTRLVLVNAIYFKGNWSNKFDKALTYKDDFMLKDGTKITVDMMKMTNKKFRYKMNPAGLSACTCEFPYGDKSTAMTIILPHEGDDISKLESQLTASKLAEVFEYPPMPGPVPIHAYIPKFKMEYKNELSDCLKSFGMTDAFDEIKSDFRLMTDDYKGLIISKVIHQSVVEVNEEGAEAAAATAVVMMKRCAIQFSPPPEEFKCNRPFLFVIHETQNNGILFMGKLMKPPTI